MDARTTRISLLVRVRDAADQGAWREFEQRYGELILRYALVQGLQFSDAEDVRQDVLLRLARYLRAFEYQAERGRFRDYLGAVVRNAIRNSRRRPAAAGNPVEMEELDQFPATGESDPAWELEWMNHHYRLALETIRRTFDPRSVAAFERLVAGESTESVAEALHLNVEAVRKIRQRVRARVTELVAEQICEEESR